MLNYTLFLWLSLFAYKSHSMICQGVLLNEPVSLVEAPANKDDFLYSQAILEEAMFSHGVSFRAVDSDEFLIDRLQGAVYMQSYVITLPNQDQFMIQLKYILRKPSESYYYSLDLIDLDSVLEIFTEERYEFLISFLDPDQHPPLDHPVNPNHPEHDARHFKAIQQPGFAIQLIDENSELFTEGRPNSVQSIFEDHTNNELRAINFQKVLRIMMSYFSSSKPEQ